MVFWEPHTASIDFCEPNYVHGEFVVEPHNVWSSFVGITLPGFIGFWRACKAPPGSPLGEYRVKLSHLILAVTGLGSMGLHGTLHWVFQSSDELPMLYLLLSDAYAVVELDAAIGKPAYPWLGPAMIGATLFNTLVYYIFQDLYWVFLTTFALGCCLITYCGARMVYGSQARENGPEVIRVWFTAMVSYLGLATPVWILDMLLCHHGVEDLALRLPGFLRGWTPHVIWHFAAGLGGYCLTIFLMLVRAEALGVPFTVDWFLGVWPIVAPLTKTKDS